jgi:hypothetical protein
MHKLCLTQLYRWRHSVSDVAEYVTTEKVTRIYFQYTSCIHIVLPNSEPYNKLSTTIEDGHLMA